MELVAGNWYRITRKSPFGTGNSSRRPGTEERFGLLMKKTRYNLLVFKWESGQIETFTPQQWAECEVSTLNG